MTQSTVSSTPMTVSSMKVVTPTSASVMPTAVRIGSSARAGQMDLFAGGRDLGIEWAHEM